MRTRQTSQERRRQIADAAIKIIGESGLRQFTAAHLAAEVGIKDATIFRHFKDMNAVKLAAFERLQELLHTGPNPSTDPLERLGDFVVGRMHSVAAQPGIQALVFSDQIAHGLGDEGPRRAAALRNRGRDFVRACLQEAADKQLLRKDVDVESAIVLITGLVMGFLFAAKDGAFTASIEEMATRSWQTLRIALAESPVTS